MSDVSLVRKHGDTFTLPVRMEDPAEEPIVITGATLRFLLGPYTDASTGVTVTRDDVGGTFTYVVDSTRMEALAHDTRYDLEVEIVFVDGTKETLISGDLYIQADKIT